MLNYHFEIKHICFNALEYFTPITKKFYALFQRKINSIFLAPKLNLTAHKKLYFIPTEKLEIKLSDCHFETKHIYFNTSEYFMKIFQCIENI